VDSRWTPGVHLESSGVHLNSVGECKVLHGHSSYLRICKIFGLFLSFKDFILFYKDLACEIDSNFCWLMFFGKLKLRFELEKLSNKFILDLAKFQVDFSLEDFNFYFSNNFKMNLDFNFIKFPAPHPSELPFIKFPAKSRINALNTGQSHYNAFQNPILQYKVQTLSVRWTSHLTSHGQEAIGSTSEYLRTLNLRTRKEANKPFKLIKFPATPRHTINPLNLIDPKQDRVLNCIADLNWKIKEFIFQYSRSQWTLPKKLDFNESELQPDQFIKMHFMDWMKMTNTLYVPPMTPLIST